MLKGRGRNHHIAPTNTQSQLAGRTNTLSNKAPLARPEPDYEVVEFQSDQYVNAKLHRSPPPPPPRPTGPLAESSAPCGLCGGGGARVRCTECGSRSLCASCDDMYHRHPKRRNHQRQALPLTQTIRIERPPLPPKILTPVPPPRRHKASGDRTSSSPRPPSAPESRRATLGPLPASGQFQAIPASNFSHQLPYNKMPQTSMVATNVGSMPYLSNSHHASVTQLPQNVPPVSATWGRPRTSLQNYNLPQHLQGLEVETWENQRSISPTASNWGRPLRRGASVLELAGGMQPCSGCAHCTHAPSPWRYASCANLDHPWLAGWPQTCCPPPAPPHHHYPPRTPQPNRRPDMRGSSRTASRAGSRAPSPSMSVRSRTSRRPKHRTPSPPPLPSSSSGADSESEGESEPEKHSRRTETAKIRTKDDVNTNVSCLASAPSVPTASWQCEHCTYVNEPGVKVCVICCRTPTTAPKLVTTHVINDTAQIAVSRKNTPSPVEMRTPKSRIMKSSRKERSSTGCGPSPPRETQVAGSPQSTPIKENRQDTAVGSSPPKEITIDPKKVTPQREIIKTFVVEKHSVSVGPSPPRDTSSVAETANSIQKKSTGTSPPQNNAADSISSSISQLRLSTGTSPPPQNISTQTYEALDSWDRGASPAPRSRSRARRRLRDHERRERSHSRHSLSSDTRESERSARTSLGGGRSGGRWEKDGSPAPEWSGSEPRTRLSRRASHLDLRTRTTRRDRYEISPEPLSATRAISLEALVAASGRREAERGLELAQLMSDAERLGFSAAEVQAALAQSPAAPLAWLRERWPSLCAGVRAAAMRLAPNAVITERDARAALAKHRGAMWPAVTDCVEKHRRQKETGAAFGGMSMMGDTRRHGGRVWGPPAGAEDEAAPPARGKPTTTTRPY